MVFKGEKSFKAVELLTRIIENPQFRAKFLGNPQGVIKEQLGQNLDDDQIKAVEKITKDIQNLNIKTEIDGGGPISID